MKTNSVPATRYGRRSPFAADTDYFGPGPQSCMINFRVDDLDALLAQLRTASVEVDERVDQGEFGRFGWIVDPEGTRIELWQPTRTLDDPAACGKRPE